MAGLWRLELASGAVGHNEPVWEGPSPDPNPRFWGFCVPVVAESV